MLDSVKMLACLRACKILQWNINRNVLSSNGIKSLRVCGFQTHRLDSVDDERWDTVGFCINACMLV